MSPAIFLMAAQLCAGSGSAVREYRQVPVAELLALGWGSTVEAGQKRLGKTWVRKPSSLCKKDESGPQVCLIYSQSGLTSIEYTYPPKINMVVSLFDQYGQPQEERIRPFGASYCWVREGFDMTVNQRMAQVNPEGAELLGGETVALVYSKSNGCAPADAGTK